MTDTEKYAANLRKAVFDLESDASAIQVELQNVEALLFFLSEFFSAESIDPRSADGTSNIDAIVRIMHYPHYQGLFNTIVTTVQNAAGCVDRLNTAIDSALQLGKPITEGAA